MRLKFYPNLKRYEFRELLLARDVNQWMLRFAEGDPITNHAQYAVLAWLHGEVIGYWAFEIRNTKKPYIRSAGTYVLRPHRRQGLGKRMWRFGMSKLPYEVEAVAVTPAGRGFLYDMKDQSPGRVRTWVNL